MPAAAEPKLKPGRVYRTQEFLRWGRNATRLVRRLERLKLLLPLGHGLYFRPEQSRFGPVPPADEEVVRGFLKDAPFLLSGSSRWNALGLGSSAVAAEQLVYNTKRSGTFRFGNRIYRFRRVRFPRNPTPEWFAVDLLQNHEMAGVGLGQLREGLERAIRTGRLRAQRLRESAGRYGTRRTRSLVDDVVRAAGVE
jgi:hypothetical protein